MNALSNTITINGTKKIASWDSGSGCTDPGPTYPVVPPSGNSPAVASPGGDTVNDNLIDFGGQILGNVEQNASDPNYSGFSGVVADLSHAMLRLYWQQGQSVPAGITDISSPLE